MERYELRKYNEREYGIYDTEQDKFIQKGSLKVMQGALQDYRNGKMDSEKQFEDMVTGFAAALKNESKEIVEEKEVKLESKLVEANGTDVASEAIMSYSSDNGKTLDQEWLNNDIQLYIDNERALYDGMINSRRPAHSIAYDGLMIAINSKVEGHGDLTSRQVQAGFRQLGLDFKEVIKPSVEYVEERRKELQEESKMKDEFQKQQDIKDREEDLKHSHTGTEDEKIQKDIERLKEETKELEEDCTQASNVDGGKIDSFPINPKDKKEESKAGYDLVDKLIDAYNDDVLAICKKLDMNYETEFGEIDRLRQWLAEMDLDELDSYFHYDLEGLKKEECIITEEVEPDNEYDKIIKEIKEATTVDDVNNIIMDVEDEELREELVNEAQNTDVFDYNQAPQNELNSYKEELCNTIEDYKSELEESKEIKTEDEEQEDKEFDIRELGNQIEKEVKKEFPEIAYVQSVDFGGEPFGEMDFYLDKNQYELKNKTGESQGNGYVELKVSDSKIHPVCYTKGFYKNGLFDILERKYGFHQDFNFDEVDKVVEFIKDVCRFYKENLKNESLEDNTDPENKFHNEDGSVKTLVDYIEDKIGVKMTAGELCSYLQTLFMKHTLFITEADLYDLDPDETQEIVIDDDGEFYVIKYKIVDQMEGIVEVTDLEID